MMGGNEPGTVRLKPLILPYLVDGEVIMKMTDEKGNTYSVILDEEIIKVSDDLISPAVKSNN